MSEHKAPEGDWEQETMEAFGEPGYGPALFASDTQGWVEPGDTVTKTVERVEYRSTPGAYGWEPMVVFYFNDNTRCGIVMPGEED